MLKKLKYVATIALVVVFLISLAYVIVARTSDQAPSMFGYSLLRIPTESMEPALKSGDIVVIKDTEPEKLNKGDIISYNGTKGNVKGQTVTHQIVAEPYEKDGTYYFTTRGTRYGALDDPEIKDSQIIGKVLVKIPVIGTLYDFFSKWYGILAFVTVIILAYSGELLELFKKITKKNDESDTDVPANAAVPDFRPEFNNVLIKNNSGEDFITSDGDD